MVPAVYSLVYLDYSAEGQEVSYRVVNQSVLLFNKANRMNSFINHSHVIIKSSQIYDYKVLQPTLTLRI